MTHKSVTKLMAVIFGALFATAWTGTAVSSLTAAEEEALEEGDTVVALDDVKHRYTKEDRIQDPDSPDADPNTDPEERRSWDE